MSQPRKILLDHSVPQRLRRHLSDHEVHSAQYLNWEQLENGDLLRAAAENGYQIVITGDLSMKHQNNLEEIGIQLVELENNNWTILRQHTREIQEAINSIGNLSFVTVRIPLK